MSSKEQNVAGVLFSKASNYQTLHLYLYVADGDLDTDSTFVCRLNGKTDVTYHRVNDFYYATTEIPVDIKKLRYSLNIKYSDVNYEDLFYDWRLAIREQDLKKDRCDHVAMFDVVNRQIRDRQNPPFQWSEIFKEKLPRFLQGAKALAWNKKLYLWHLQIVYGWSTRGNPTFYLKEEDLGRLFHKALSFTEKNTPLERISNMILFLGLTIDYLKIDKNVFDTVCESLVLDDLPDIGSIINQLDRDKISFQYPTEIGEILKRIFDQISLSNKPEWILALPLYSLYNNHKLPESVTEKWSNVEEKMKCDSSQRALVSMFNRVVKLSEGYPWIARQYFGMTTCGVMIDLLSRRPKEVLFDALIVVRNLSARLKNGETELRYMQDIEEYFWKFADEVKKQTDTKHRNLVLFVVKNVVHAAKRDDVSWEVLIWTAYFLAKCVKYYLALGDFSDLLSVQLSTFAKKIQDKLGNIVIDMTFFEKDFMNYKIKIWTQMFECQWNSELVQNIWMTKTHIPLEMKLRSCESMEINYLEAYSSTNNSSNEELQKILDDVAYDYFVQLVKSNKMFDFALFKHQWQMKNLTRFSEKFFQDESAAFGYIEGSTVNERQLEFILNWEVSHAFYRHIYEKLELDVYSPVTTFTKTFETAVLNNLQNKQIELGMLFILVSKLDVAKSIIREIQRSKNEAQEAVQEIFNSLDNVETRAENLMRVMQHAQDFKILSSICHKVGIGLQKHELMSVIPENYKTKTLEEMEKFISLSDDVQAREDQWTITHHMQTGMRNVVFLQRCAEIPQLFSDHEMSNLSTNEAVYILLLFLGKLNIYAKQILEGETTIKCLRTWEILLQEQSGTLENHVKNFCEETTITREESETQKHQFEDIAQKIRWYEQLTTCKPVIDMLVLLKNKFGFEGEGYINIQTMQTLLKDEKSLLKSFTSTIGNVIPILDTYMKIFKTGNIDLPKTISAFVREVEFIEWLQDKLTGVAEIDVLAELALTHGIDGGVRSVSSFVKAINGFEPLLFNKDELPLGELLLKCERLVENIKNNNSLVEDWQLSAANLEFFREIEFSHGSVEKSSLESVRIINERGIFEIHLKSNELPTLENIVHVHIPTDEAIEGSRLEQDMKTTFDFSYLWSLQSTLTLMGGLVETGMPARYSHIFEIVEKLAKTLIRLVEDGFTLFSSCCIKIIPAEEYNVRMNISFAKDENSVQELFSIADAENVAIELMNTLTKWKKHVKQLRMKYYCLNEYSISQIVYLCHHLAEENIAAENQQDQVIALLSVIDSDVDFDLIPHLLQIAEDKLRQEKIPDQEEEFPLDSDPNDIEIQKMKISLKALIKKVKKKEKIVKAAIQQCGHSEMAKCQNWILKYQYDTVLIEDLSTKFDRKIVDLKNSRASLSHKPLGYPRSISKHETLLKYLDEKCSFFTATSAVSDQKDFISMAHLGEFLMQLNFKKRSENLFHRRLPWPLQPGVPNLHICADHEMYLRLLSLYMDDHTQPLPTTSEVLICTDKTTVDEVERFFCRAMNHIENNGDPIFCMAFSDRLTDSVMKTAENIYEELKKSCKENYQLAILSSDSTTYLAACFEKFQVAGNFVKRLEEISDYVQNHLIVKHTFEKSIAAVDNIRSSVRLVVSGSVGAGKSLYISRKQEEALRSFKEKPRIATIRFLENEMQPETAIQKLLPNEFKGSFKDEIFVYIDITNAVKKGMEEFVFSLFVLGKIVDNTGKVWTRHPNQYYMLEMTDNSLVSMKHSESTVLNLFPHTIALQPQEVLDEKFRSANNTVSMDPNKFVSPVFQRPYQYLKRYKSYQAGGQKDKKLLKHFTYTERGGGKGSEEECIQILLEYCGASASWAQFNHFVTFLNLQLLMCETWCEKNKKLIKGVKEFMMKYIINMAKHFIRFNDHNVKTSSIESEPFIFFHGTQKAKDINLLLLNVKLVHPRLFDLQNREIHSEFPNMEKEKLGKRKIHIVQNFDLLSRGEQIRLLCLASNVAYKRDPDPSYKLTTDNLKKLLLTNMRIQCKIPVVIMGETGCGKTRMIEFLSKLKSSGSNNKDNEMLITRKVYGGITTSDIWESVAKASDNRSLVEREMKILFFDEANTTEAIYAIKEVMCDNTFDGEPIDTSNLAIIAACNPYKKIPDAAIKRLGACGLAGKIHVSQAEEKSGSQVRNLLYKVLPLPPSMEPYVWTFPQPNDSTEELYIKQIANNLVVRKSKLLSKLVSRAQKFIREQDDVFRFVSLRDVERCMTVCQWFHKHGGVIFPLIDEEKFKVYQAQNKEPPTIIDEVRETLHALNVCYHSSLHHERMEFRKSVSKTLAEESISNITEEDISQEFLACQKVFLLQANIQGTDNISFNKALMENFFMMVICVDLRIPLFVIGKPGSSKSLAKTLVSKCMRGRFSDSRLFKGLKQANMMSYQCSALSDAAGIIHTFDQCWEMQESNDLNTFATVAVLDEIGLAEDSPSMPLKVLHPLLEFGNMKNSDRKKKVAFLGISNWPLDPAKLNRGAFLLHENPVEKDLYQTALDICGVDKETHPRAPAVLEVLTNAYLEIEDSQKVHQEYFGLRDFYSLVKSCVDHFENPKMLYNAVVRNFGGSESQILEKFQKAISTVFHEVAFPQMPIDVVVQNNLDERDSRYLLLLTNYIPSINLVSLVVKDFHRMKVILGSSFPGDGNFAEICRNIQEVKTCMETGTPVVMLNLTDIQESFYDALNQHYNTLGGKRYVDIGLGSQRLKCCVSPLFRLIILEQKKKAYIEYPIPLLNRLEKHLLDSDGLLPDSERPKMKELQEWTQIFVADEFKKSDSLIGHQKDTVSSTLLLCSDKEVCKEILLQSASMDAMYRLGTSLTDIDELNKLHATYFVKQSHHNLADLLRKTLQSYRNQNFLSCNMLEVVSFSGSLVGADREQLEKSLNLIKHDVMILNVRAFHTLKEFEDDVDTFLKGCKNNPGEQNPKILILQCPHAHDNAKLIECAKHSWANRDQSEVTAPIITVVLWSIERSAEFLMQQSQDNRIIYIDEVRPLENDENNTDVLSTQSLLNKSLPEIFSPENANVASVKKFLKDCLSKAMVKIEGSQNAAQRYKVRVQIISNLLQEENEISMSFRHIFLNKLNKILLNENKLRNSDWVNIVAKNKANLQEGGTFHRSLLLYLKTLISNLIAHCISDIDVQCNLNLIEKFPTKDYQGTEVKNIWLSIFEKVLFDSLQLDWMNRDFIAVSPITECPSLTCKFPFGFLITNILLKKLESLANYSLGKLKERLTDSFKQHKIYPVVSQAISLYPELINYYITDLVKSHYTPSFEEHLEIEVEAVIKLVQKRSFSDKINCESGEELVLLFATFSDMKDKLSILRDVFKVCPFVAESLNNDMWNKDWDWHGGELHLWGMKLAFGELTKKTAEFSENPSSCLEWMKLSASIEKTVYLVLDSIQTQEKKDELVKAWLPLSLLNVLLLQLIPNDSFRHKYAEVIANSAELLVTVPEENNIEDLTIIVCNTLRGCYSDLQLRMLLSWGSVTCRKCNEEMEDPQRLSCGHFLCLRCCQQILVDLVPKCPRCLNSFQKNGGFTAATLSAADEKKLQGFQFSCSSFFIDFLKNICFVSVMKPTSSEEARALIKLILTLLVPNLNENESTLESVAICSDINTKACIFGELIKSNPNIVTGEINAILQGRNGQRKKEIVQFILYYYEQQLYTTTTNTETDLQGIHLLVKAQNLNLETLEAMAVLRNICRNLAIQLYEKGKDDSIGEMNDFIGYFVDFCKGCNVVDVKELVIKAGCQHFGLDWYRKMLESEVAKVLIPHKWREVSNVYSKDHWLLFEEILAEVEGGLQKPLKGYRDFIPELAAKPPTRNKLMYTIKRKCKKSIMRHGSISGYKTQLDSLINLDRKIAMTFQNLTSVEDSRERGFVQMLVMSVAASIQKGCQMMSGFRSFALEPAKTSSLELSTMLTEITEPNLEDATLIIRFILHASILIGYANNSNAVLIMLKKSVRTPELDNYLSEKLYSILIKLKRMWGLDLLDTALMMHHVLGQIWESEHDAIEDNYDWISPEGRREWKRKFQERYLFSIVGVVQQTLQDIKSLRRKSLLQSPLFRFLHDCDTDDNSVPENLLWKRQALCYYTELCCFERLEQVVQNERNSILKSILSAENLELVQHLESALKLQRILIKRCQGTLSYEEAEKNALLKYLKDDEFALAEKYIALWNKAVPTIRQRPAVSPLLREHIQELNLESPVAMFLPSDIGRGQCAKILAGYLIDLQNTVIDNCKASDNTSYKFHEIDVGDVTSTHILNVERYRDILPLIQTHAVYTITVDEFGKHHNLQYKLDVLEKQLEVKFLKDKRIILKKTLPRIWYSSNAGIESDWNDLISCNPQIELSANIKMQTEGISAYSAIVYQAVRSLEDGIKRLAKVRMKPKKRLDKFLEEDCKISPSELTGIPSTACIEHTLALYSRLSWHRSVLYFSRGLDPYSEILPEGSQEAIHDEATNKKLKGVLECIDISTCQQFLNEIIIRLPGTSPQKRLAKDVFPNVVSPFFKSTKSKQWYSRIPDEIRFRNISYLFKQTLGIKNK